MYFRCREENNINIPPPCTSQASRSQFEELEIMYMYMYTQYTIRQSGKGKCLFYLFPQMIHNSTIRPGNMFILSVSANDHAYDQTN